MLRLLLVVCPLALAHSPRPDLGPAQKNHFFVTPNISDGLDFHYHDYDGLTAWAHSVASSCPRIMKLSSIGKSVQGRELWVMKISQSAQEDSGDKPEFLYVGNIHGDETVGREVLIHFVQAICDAYNRPEWSGIPGISWEYITQLVDLTDIYVLFSLNPDGFELKQRENANGVDMNRNFPDQFHGAAAVEEPEVSALKSFLSQRRFALGTNLHGGALLCNYPWDGLNNHNLVASTASLCPDDQLYQSLCLTYSTNHSTMSSHSEFPNGITNGAAWYPVFGGMQDWSYVYQGMLHVTLELSDIKAPPESSLETEWRNNYIALFKFVERIHGGVRGHVDFDSLPTALQYSEDVGVVVTNLSPPSHAIEPPPAAQTIRTKIDPTTGRFARVLLPGVYNASLVDLDSVIASVTFTVPPPTLEGKLSIGLAHISFTGNDVQLVQVDVTVPNVREWRRIPVLHLNFLLLLLVLILVTRRRRLVVSPATVSTNTVCKV